MDRAQRKRLGEQLRALRLERRLSQEKLAELAGFHPTYVQKVEAGQILPSLPALRRLASALGVDGWEILRAVESTPVSGEEESLLGEITTLVGGLSGRNLLFARDFLRFLRRWNEEHPP